MTIAPLCDVDAFAIRVKKHIVAITSSRASEMLAPLKLNRLRVGRSLITTIAWIARYYECLADVASSIDRRWIGLILQI
jgi:hypothetical protein